MHTATIFRAVGFLLACFLLLSGCAQPSKVPPARADATEWTGRLAMTVGVDASQSFSAVFALEGSVQQGSLTLSTPLGTVLAELAWSPQGARLTAPQREQTAASLDELLADALGSPVPVAALFSWLHGETLQASGWRADLSQLSEGRLTAVREQPLPRTTLRLVLDR